MVSPDDFSAHETGFNDPARKAFSITPADGTDLTNPTRAIYVGGAGNLTVIFEEDSAAVTITGVLAGTVYPFAVSRVNATGTTATNLVGLR